MKKTIFALALAFAFAGTASAASISNPLFSNGDTTISTTGDSTVNGTFTLTVGPGEVVEVVRTWVNGWPFTDESVGDQLGYQEGVYTNVPFSVTAPPNTGNYTPRAQGAGIYGGIRAIHGGDNVVVGPVALGTIRVVANGSTNVGGPSEFDEIHSTLFSLGELIKELTKTLLKDEDEDEPVIPNNCATLNQKLAGTMDHVYNDANVRLQGFLLSEGMSIPALAAGASFGYKGSQTNAALSMYKSMNGCI
jgi:hypothetical protein